MNYRKPNILIVSFIILCSTSFYNLKALGPAQKAVPLLGVGIVIGLLILHLVYGNHHQIKHQYSIFIAFIFISFFTSMIMANYDRDQTIPQSLFAQRALFYYLFYFLLHQMRIRPRDLEWIIISFGILHGVLFILQYLAYPTILFNTFIIIGRGTIRIYLPGSDYLAICFFMSIMAFLRTNKPKYLLYMLLSFSVFVLLGGRQTMALMAFVLLLAVFFSRKVKSRLGITVLIGAGILLVFILFQSIFQGMMVESKSNTAQGFGYVRIRAAQYFLTDFYKSTIAYIAGNGVPFGSSSYGKMIESLKISQGFYLADIGILGSYITFGIFFLIGVFGMIFKTLRSKFDNNYLYIKFVFIGFLLSLATGSGFGNADFICSLCCLLYIIDVSQPEASSDNISRESFNQSDDS